MASEQIAIVGATGFIGQALSERLSESGYQLHRFNSTNPISNAFQPASPLVDVSTIYWLASRINPSKAADQPSLVVGELDEWTRFLKFIKEFNPSCHVIFASSGGASYSDEYPPFSESSVANGINEYGRTKIAMESALVSSEIHSTILRIANVFGPGQRTGTGQGVIAHWLSEILAGNPIHVFGSLEVIRDFIYVDDVVDALQLCLNHSEGLGIINIGSGEPVTLSFVLLEIQKSLNVQVELLSDPTRAIDRPSVWLDVALSERLLGWKAKTSLNTGIGLTLESYGSQ